ncbi:hypothetical protein [Microvirga arsenatis]|uniref:Uncharacterized protein n=1 Tax=Microvirga arsenatis TaxID=2692265 RepID=A0ABW9Z304_9HYPH|nr:hypothetical protein [Microvirga arsenatis]NBJ13600.1 hypothetical protein [Microvirga arsenatis]NBJ27072.1 hypothetical protein [Microvirga arsenatis]
MAMATEVVTATVAGAETEVATQEAGIAVARLAVAQATATAGAPGILMEADMAAGLEVLATMAGAETAVETEAAE